MTKREDLMIEELRKIFVSFEVFDLRLKPIEKLLYGTVSVVGVLIITALMSYILIKR